jgi:RND family efflux transporter MFP subunit
VSEVSGLAAKRRRRRVGWWLVAFLAIGLGLAWALFNRPWEPKPVIVATETITSGPASRVLAINGRAVPTQQVEVNSTVNARVSSVLVAEGDAVSNGAPMLTLDDREQVAAVAEAEVQVDAAQTRVSQTQADYDRALALADSISQKSIDDARFALEAARQDVERAAALLEQAQSRLSEYVVRAPFDGTVLSRGADPGQVVSGSSSLFLFADLSTLHAEASVDELYASEVRRGLRVVARAAGHNGTIEGEVAYVSPRVDASTGGRQVRVTLPGAGEQSVPVGLTVLLNIVVNEQADAITIPRSALISGELPAVYVVEGDKALRRTIEFVDWPSDRLIVTSGLAPGEVLIVDSKSIPADGALVAGRG